MKILSISLIALAWTIGNSQPASAGCDWRGVNNEEGAYVRQDDQRIHVCRNNRWENLPPGVIVLEQAKFGTPSAPPRFIDVLAKVKSECENNASCIVTPSVSWAGGDPAPNFQKALYVYYYCKDNNGRRIRGSEVDFFGINANESGRLLCD